MKEQFEKMAKLYSEMEGLRLEHARKQKELTELLDKSKNTLNGNNVLPTAKAPDHQLSIDDTVAAPKKAKSNGKSRPTEASTLGGAIEKVFNGAKAPLSAADVAKMIDKELKLVKLILGGMVKDGRLKVVGKGRGAAYEPA